MIIPEATSQTLELDAKKRSRYLFHSLAGRIGRRETSEAFVSSEALRDAGLLVEPFWESPGDLEGDTYQAYVKKYPDFTLAVREGVYERLLRAQSQLPAGWQLVLKAGFRPLDVQVALLTAFIDKSHDDHPDWPEDRHLQHARTFVSDPDLVCPPHVTGGAVDINVKNLETGQYVDMGCAPNTDSEIAFLHSDALTEVQYENRMILLDAMLAAGFAPNPQEWWHYQYGETYWAAFYGHTMTQYDLLSM